MSGPTVSIILPCFNGERFLARALDSVLAQTYTDWELVLVDDGSTDGSARVAHAYAQRFGDRLRFIQQANAGSSAARNRAIDESRGAFLAFLDADDEFLPDKLERQLALFDRCPDLGLVYSDYSFVDLDGTLHESVFNAKGSLAREVPHREVGPGQFVCTERLFDLLLREYFIATIVGMVRREVVGETIRFPKGRSYAEEWLFYLKIARTCRTGFVAAPLCLHHHVEGSLSRTDRSRNTSRLYDLLLNMKRELPELNVSQRKTLREHLGRTCRQLAFDADRDGRRLGSIRWLARSAWHSPSVRIFAGLLATMGKALRPMAGVPT